MTTVARTEATIDAGDSFSDPVWIDGPFNFVLTEFGADNLAHLQRAFGVPATVPAGGDWHDVASFAAIPDPQLVGDEPEGAWYRFGVKAGNLAGGVVAGRISRANRRHRG